MHRRNFQSFIKLEHYVRKGLLGSSLIELKVSQTNIEIDSRRDDNERARREGNRVQVRRHQPAILRRAILCHCLNLACVCPVLGERTDL